MKKVVSMVLLIIMVTSMFAGCGSKDSKVASGNSEQSTEASTDSQTGDTGKEDTVTLMVPPVSSTYLDKVYEWAEEFHTQYPNLTIEITETSWDDHLSKLSTLALAGEAPDIAELGYSSIGNYVQMGVGVNLSDYLDETVLGDYDETALEYMSMEGNLYGLPLYLSIQSIGANKEMLEAAGVDVKSVQENGWTFDEFMTAIAKGTKGDCKGFVFATSSATASDLMNIFGVSAGLTNAFTSELKYEYTSQNMLTFLQAIETMCNSGYMPNYGVDASQRMVMCETGNAMIFGKAMPLFESNINTNNKAIQANDGTAVEGSIEVEYAFLPVPTMDNVNASCYGTVDGMMAFRNNNTTEEHLANVALAMNFLCSGERAAYLNNELYLTSVCESGRSAGVTATQERDADNQASAARLINLVQAPPSGITAEMSSTASTLMEEVIAPKFQALLAGECSAQEMYDTVCESAFSAFGEENCETGTIQ